MLEVFCCRFYFPTSIGTSAKISKVPPIAFDWCSNCSMSHLLVDPDFWSWFWKPPGSNSEVSLRVWQIEAEGTILVVCLFAFQQLFKPDFWSSSAILLVAWLVFKASTCFGPLLVVLRIEVHGERPKKRPGMSSNQPLGFLDSQFLGVTTLWLGD